MNNIKSIIDEFIEVNDLKNNKNILAFILYGSFVTNKNNSMSDVDILIILNGKESFRVAKMYEGYHLDIHALSIPDVEKHIVYELQNGNEYIKSVLTTGLFLINRDYTIEYLRSILSIGVRRFRRVVNPAMANLAVDKASDFLESKDNDDFKYFIALEYLRKVIHVKLNASTIPELKVYKLYNNVDIANNQYCLKLPNKEFIELYLSALLENDATKRKEYIIKLLNYLVGIKVDDSDYYQDELFDDNSIKKLLVSLNHLVITCEDNIIKNTPYANPLYFITLDRIMGVIKRAFLKVPDNAQEIFNNSLKELSEDDRIKAIEDLFHVVDSKYKMDYDDFVLKL